jgi:hypothetical protein
VAATLLASPALAADHAKLTAANSGTYTLDKSHANVVFGVNHLGFSSYLGRFNSFDATLTLDGADPTKSKVEVTITPASVDTNNSELEEKLRGENWFAGVQSKFPFPFNHVDPELSWWLATWAELGAAALLAIHCCRLRADFGGALGFEQVQLVEQLNHGGQAAFAGGGQGQGSPLPSRQLVLPRHGPSAGRLGQARE